MVPAAPPVMGAQEEQEMSEDIEERFRAACSAYLAAAEEHDQACAAEAAAFMAAQAARLAADRARDELLQVVRERDLQAQLDARPPLPVIAVIDPVTGRDTGATIIGGRIMPSPRAAAARGEFMARYVQPDTQECDCQDYDAVQRYDDKGRPVIEDD